MPTPPDDIALNKAAIIERCIRRIRDEYAACPTLDDFTHLDALTLNVERACQAAIDLAMHRVAQGNLGVPQHNAAAFTLLEQVGIIDSTLARALRAMNGFRNIAVHQYAELDPAVLHWVATTGHHDWIIFCRALGLSIRP